MEQQQKPRRLPYGMQNREDVRLSGYYYVGKTRLVLLWRGMELAVTKVTVCKSKNWKLQFYEST